MDAGGRSRGILKVQVSRTRLQPACKDRTNPGKREHYGRYSSIPTNVPPDLMRDVLPAATRRRQRLTTSAHNVTHNAGSQRSRNSRNSRNSRRSPPHVVLSKVHKHNILWLASLTKASEFHLYYDI